MRWLDLSAICRQSLANLSVRDVAEHAGLVEAHVRADGLGSRETPLVVGVEHPVPGADTEFPGVVLLCSVSPSAGRCPAACVAASSTRSSDQPSACARSSLLVSVTGRRP